MVNLKAPEDKKPEIKKKSNYQKNQSTINFGENSTKTIGPPVPIAKSMRSFEKDESLFNFGNVKPAKGKAKVQF